MPFNCCRSCYIYIYIYICIYVCMYVCICIGVCVWCDTLFLFNFEARNCCVSQFHWFPLRFWLDRLRLRSCVETILVLTSYLCLSVARKNFKINISIPYRFQRIFWQRWPTRMEHHTPSVSRCGRHPCPMCFVTFHRQL